MRRSIIITLLFGLLLCSCAAQEAVPPPTNTPIPIDQLVAEAFLATQTAEQSIPPSFPYLPAQIALLVDPGNYLGGGWQTSTVYDLTRPYPPLDGMCGGYYGGCGNFFPEIVYGAEVELIRDGDALGEVSFIYTGNPKDIDRLYKIDFDKSSEVDQYLSGKEYNKIWLHFLNQFQREDLGDQWFHEVGFDLHDVPGESTAENRVERELLSTRIKIFHCHGYLRIEIRYLPENPWNSPEDNMEKRLIEQEEKFDLVYQYARAVLERIDPYACNP